MDPRKNPYSPGAGSPPPELAGRADLILRGSIALDRIRASRSSRSFIYYGLRGVGKTVLLNKIRRDAEANDIRCVWIEAPEDRSLPGLLVPALRSVLIRISAGMKVKAQAERALSVLRAFAATMKVKYGDVELSFDGEPGKGLADSGDLASDLTDLLGVIGDAAAERDNAVVLFIDELQYVKEDQLAGLITALHRASQNQLPVTMVAAGLPQLIGQMGRAKSYAERLFEFILVDSLDDEAARDALCVPAEREGVTFEDAAITAILRHTAGYPYFLQEWGKHSWNFAEASPIRLKDTETATDAVLAELDNSFFRVRFDRLTPSERRYMRAMAELGPGPHRSGDIANLLGKRVTAVAPVRSLLIAKGMVYGPAHGDTAFTVPLFDGFLKRIIPKFEKA